MTCKAGFNLHCGYGRGKFDSDGYVQIKENVCACCSADDHCLTYLVDIAVPSSKCACDACAPGFELDFSNMTCAPS